MTYSAFRESMAAATPPAHLSPYLQALWFAGNNQWDAAHDLVQDLPDKKAAHIHAYLHRLEGDDGNAGYWYASAGVKFPGVAVEDEWEQLVKSCLEV
ncbi:hypothetical protein [Flavihumibacter petaseus]|nr:hypothetical protein [Flavihumibacter petaseus]